MECSKILSSLSFDLRQILSQSHCTDTISHQSGQCDWLRIWLISELGLQHYWDVQHWSSSLYMQFPRTTQSTWAVCINAIWIQILIYYCHTLFFLRVQPADFGKSLAHKAKSEGSTLQTLFFPFFIFHTFHCSVHGREVLWKFHLNKTSFILINSFQSSETDYKQKMASAHWKKNTNAGIPRIII